MSFSITCQLGISFIACWFRTLTSAVLSCQDLHELVQDAHAVTLHVSRLNQAARPIIRLLEESYKDTIAHSKRHIDVVGIVGYISLTLRYFTGRSTGNDAEYRKWVAKGAEATQKKMRVRDCKCCLSLVLLMLPLVILTAQIAI